MSQYNSLHIYIIPTNHFISPILVPVHSQPVATKNGFQLFGNHPYILETFWE